jgi:hypothetical protein
LIIALKKQKKIIDNFAIIIILQNREKKLVLFFCSAEKNLLLDSNIKNSNWSPTQQNSKVAELRFEYPKIG